ncbi:hypothetical protein Tco_0612342 [Tanacetum coccineum]
MESGYGASEVRVLVGHKSRLYDYSDPLPDLLYIFIFSMRSEGALYLRQESVEEDDRKRACFNGNISSRKEEITGIKYGVFGALCYPTNNNEDLGKLQPTADIGIFISSGLIPNPVPAAPYVPPTNKELEILFQPMFNEYLEPPHIERSVSPALAVPVPVNSVDTPSSNTIDQDAL